MERENEEKVPDAVTISEKKAEGTKKELFRSTVVVSGLSLLSNTKTIRYLGRINLHFIR